MTGERGVAAVMVALSVMGLLVVAAMVLDFGLVRIDRQVNRSAADAATLAGLSSLDAGDRKPHPYRGVCASLRYLSSNDARFTGVGSTTGAWTDGTGAAKADGCTDAALQGQVCVPGDPATWARFTWAGIWQGEPLKVVIQSGYELPGASPSPSPAPQWREDTLPAAQADSDDKAQGCYQLATIVTQNRKPGLGSLATAADLVTSIRSVGRVKLGAGGYAPAMLLLKRTGCTSLEVGSTAGSSWVKVFGDTTSDGVTQPGSIHADADGASCGSSVFFGKASNGIIAYAAPLASNPAAPDPERPGQITSVAGLSGLSTAYDSLTNVHASSDLGGTGGVIAPTGRELVTRKPVDDRYLAAVRQAVSNAQAGVFSVAGPPAGAKTAGPCDATGKITSLPALSVSDTLFVDCPTLKGIPTINAGRVIFSGVVAPANGETISMPYADHVYVHGASSSAALDVSSSGSTFSMHSYGNLAGGTCTDVPAAGRAAVLVIRRGFLNESTGGTLQLCNTTVITMGGRVDACLPAAYTDISSAPAPTQTPCAGVNGDKGGGQIKQTGGNVDWTAPNTLDDTLDANGDPTADATAAWASPDGPEDLALWDESAGNDSSDKYQFTGGGTFHLQGIFMVPNAAPISLSGSANFDLTNAQFVAASLALASNNTTLSMRVDPNAGVTLPRLKKVGLVR